MKKRALYLLVGSIVLLLFLSADIDLSLLDAVRYVPEIAVVNDRNGCVLNYDPSSAEWLLENSNGKVRRYQNEYTAVGNFYYRCK